jgi:DNA-binding response OmpR family regulator
MQTGFGASVKKRAPRPLDGENIETTHWEDARHWMSIYTDLLEFKRGILDRIRQDLTKLAPIARTAAQADLKIIENQMDAYQERLELWYRRVWDLAGLWLDPDERVIHYKDREGIMTLREFQLVQFLLHHPHRYFTVTQILTTAWSEPDLSPEEVRNYVARIRKVMARLQIPCDLVNRIGRGYALVFRDEERPPGGSINRALE